MKIVIGVMSQEKVRAVGTLNGRPARGRRAAARRAARSNGCAMRVAINSIRYSGVLAAVQFEHLR